jgi:hypothetical protein
MDTCSKITNAELPNTYPHYHWLSKLVVVFVQINIILQTMQLTNKNTHNWTKKQIFLCHFYPLFLKHNQFSESIQVIIWEHSNVAWQCPIQTITTVWQLILYLTDKRIADRWEFRFTAPTNTSVSLSGVYIYIYIPVLAAHSISGRWVVLCSLAKGVREVE